MAVLGNRVIKSIQRGSTSVTVASTATATITAVDTSKSFISASCKNGYGSGNISSGDTGAGVSAITAGATLTNSTTLTFTAGSYRAYNTSYATATPTVYWEVIEYE